MPYRCITGWPKEFKACISPLLIQVNGLRAPSKVEEGGQEGGHALGSPQLTVARLFG